VIVTVTPNPALDVSYQVDRLRPGHTHRIGTVHERAGGKGFNVSRVLTDLGVDTVAVGPVGGVLGDSLRTDLDDAGIRHALLPVSAPTRMTITVVAASAPEGEEATIFTEPGGPVADHDWQRLHDLVAAQLETAKVLVCSGSLPPGAPVDCYAEFVRLGHSHAIPVVVDAGGPALRHACAAGADVVKPNAAELAEAVGGDDPVAGAELLRAEGAGAVVVSLGVDGMIAVTEEGRWRAEPPYVVAGNPTGAGDAAVAALAAGMAERQPWPQRLRSAVAWSSAAVAASVAGSVDSVVLADVRDQVRLTELS
jgi:1-phosphofructokinase family hexose kinase